MNITALLIIVAALLLLALIGGCVATQPKLQPISDLKSAHGVVLRGPFNHQDVFELDRNLMAFPPSVIKSISSVSLVYYDYLGPNEAGHCHHTRDICILSGHLIAIWHEAGHAYHFYLRMIKSPFDREWNELSKGLYDPNRYSGDPTYPKDGILSGYGSRTQMEDVAVYVEMIYHRLRMPATDDMPLFSRPEFKKDFRFRAKVNLLRKYGFIGEGDYKTFCKLVRLDSED
ncbi:MAG: hypothetical protein G01um10143_315 [Parcubacteria group bacterium Gr01-1014_3]|nr:MAG: hypothetical protein G01um10143_315 [Parcubacteria group bacterium Gr01-1014_3]